MDKPPKLTTTELLEWLRERDPQATAEEHRWGFTVVDTSALEVPQILITNRARP